MRFEPESFRKVGDGPVGVVFVVILPSPIPVGDG